MTAPPPGQDPRTPYERAAQQQFGFQPAPTQASYTDWWWDGRRWRPPVPRLTRWQLISQVPGMLLKLTFLLLFLGFVILILVNL